ncbi:hypothetical protein GBAR_LOCUS26983 [Geodia barretti]|uniref:Uncharacterized protein n=1 Tax=Geodia barretti TaxID=519541 RepID=A0AA35TJD7_GEOBA|nr:hypothetical protein GBAR_LOCUS26983 [Geodia barretti]
MSLLSSYSCFYKHDNHAVYHPPLKNVGWASFSRGTCPPGDLDGVAVVHEAGVTPTPGSVPGEIEDTSSNQNITFLHHFTDFRRKEYILYNLGFLLHLSSPRLSMTGLFGLCRHYILL